MHALLMNNMRIVMQAFGKDCLMIAVIDAEGGAFEIIME